MGHVNVQINEDYPLTGVVTHFEAYMFATVDRYLKEHKQPLSGEIVIVDGNRGVDTTPMADLNDRSRCLTQFNRLAKAKIPAVPKPTGLSCCMIDLVGDKACTDADCDDVYRQLKEFFIDFMQKNDRVAVMVQHWAQGSRYPHVHMLYQRKRGKHDEFQDWLCQQ